MIADELGWPPSRLSRLESGKRGVSQRDLTMLLAVYRVRGSELDRLLEICRSSYERSWLRTNREPLLRELSVPIFHEATARKITEYEPLVVPRLLQTDDYARTTLIASKLVPDSELDLRLHAHLGSRVVFDKLSPPLLEFFISEQVLRSTIDEAHVMNGQLRHLLFLSRYRTCVVRVVPTTKTPTGLFGGPFRLLEYSHGEPAVYIQNQTTSLFLEEPDDVKEYRAILERLNELALTPAESGDFLRELAGTDDQPQMTDDNTEQAPSADSAASPHHTQPPDA